MNRQTTVETVAPKSRGPPPTQPPILQSLELLVHSETMSLTGQEQFAYHQGLLIGQKLPVFGQFICSPQAEDCHLVKHS